MNEKMKAIVANRYGGPEVLTYMELPKPRPRKHEVLVKIKATSVNAGDWRLLRAEPFFIRFFSGLFKPKNKTPGSDLSGIVEQVGEEVKEWQVGDEVFTELSNLNFGAFAEFVSVPAHALNKKPKNASFKEAAAIPVAGLTALQAVRDWGQVQPGQNIAIIGAASGVGAYAVQIAKIHGAQVTAVCRGNATELMKKIGADEIVDYQKEDVLAKPQCYDVIINVAAYRPTKDYQKILKPGGTYVPVGGSMKEFYRVLLLGKYLDKKTKKKIQFNVAKMNRPDMESLKKYVEEGKLLSPIDQTYPLAQVPDAIRYLESRGQNQGVKGKIVISLEKTNH